MAAICGRGRGVGTAGIQGQADHTPCEMGSFRNLLLEGQMCQICSTHRPSCKAFRPIGQKESERQGFRPTGKRTLFKCSSQGAVGGCPGNESTVEIRSGISTYVLMDPDQKGQGHISTGNHLKRVWSGHPAYLNVLTQPTILSNVQPLNKRHPDQPCFGATGRITGLARLVDTDYIGVLKPKEIT